MGHASRGHSEVSDPRPTSQPDPAQRPWGQGGTKDTEPHLVQHPPCKRGCPQHPQGHMFGERALPHTRTPLWLLGALTFVSTPPPQLVNFTERLARAQCGHHA